MQTIERMKQLYKFRENEWALKREMKFSFSFFKIINEFLLNTGQYEASVWNPNINIIFYGTTGNRM